MRRFAPAALLFGASLVAAQAPRFYRDPSGNIEVFATSWKLTVSGTTYGFSVSGSPVHAIVHDEGLELFAPRVQGQLAGSEKKSQLKSATASGGVRVVKAGAGGRSEITGASAVYSAQGANGTVKLTGGVRLTTFQSAKSQSMTARGTSATAVLSPGAKADNPLRTATLFGPVTIDGSQRASASETRKLHATAKRLDIDNTSKPAKLVLSGGVQADGFFGHMVGGKAVMLVNDRGEVTSLEVTR